MNTGFGGVAETLPLDLGGRRLQVVLERQRLSKLCQLLMVARV